MIDNDIHSFCPIHFSEAWAGLSWGFFGGGWFFFFFISMLDNGRSGCLYVKASHNVKAVNECSFTREFCGAAVPAMPS